MPETPERAEQEFALQLIRAESSIVTAGYAASIAGSADVPLDCMIGPIAVEHPELLLAIADLRCQLCRATVGLGMLVAEAVVSWRKAAERAARNSAHREATAHASKGVELLPMRSPRKWRRLRPRLTAPTTTSSRARPWA